MANIDYKDGTYSIGAKTTEQFTFWWGRNSKAPNEFFDVSISPAVNKANEAMQPLVEVQRAVAFVGGSVPGRIVLTMTLRNDNAFPVTFIANHVRIYG